MWLSRIPRGLVAISASLFLILGQIAAPVAAAAPGAAGTSPAAIATETSLALAANPVPFGADWSMTATITPAGSANGASAADAPAPTGTFQIFLDGKPLGAPLDIAAGTVSSKSLDWSINCVITRDPFSINCTITISFASLSALSVGDHTISAVYSGDANYAGSKSPVLVEKVVKAATTTSLKISPNPLGLGAKWALVARLTPAPAAAGFTPSGTFSVMLDGKPLGAPLPIKAGVVSAARSSYGINCVITFNPFTITCTITFGTARAAALPLGRHLVSVAYSGDAHYASSVSPVVAEQVAVPTRTSLKITPNPAIRGADWSLVAKLTPAAHNGRRVPTGTLQVMLDGKPLGNPLPIKAGSLSAASADWSIHCTITLSPFNITCTINFASAAAALSTGAHNVSLVYSGDAYYLRSVSPIVHERIALKQ